MLLQKRQRKDWPKILEEKVGVKKWKKSYGICILHFSESCIERNRTIFLKGGEVQTKLRIRPLLTDDADPSIFPSDVRKEKPSFFNFLHLPVEKDLQDNESSAIVEEKLLQNIHENDNVTNEQKHQRKVAVKRKFEDTFTALDKVTLVKHRKNDVLFEDIQSKINNYEMISELLNEMWVVNIIDNDCIVCSMWDKNYSSIEKNVMLYKDLTYKVSISNFLFSKSIIF